MELEKKNAPAEDDGLSKGQPERLPNEYTIPELFGQLCDKVIHTHEDSRTIMYHLTVSGNCVLLHRSEWNPDDPVDLKDFTQLYCKYIRINPLGLDDLIAMIKMIEEDRK